jgi:hypothetical protein
MGTPAELPGWHSTGCEARNQAHEASQAREVGPSKPIESARVQIRRAAMAEAIRHSRLIPCPR